MSLLGRRGHAKFQDWRTKPPNIKPPGSEPPCQMLGPKVRHLFRTGRPANFKLGTQMEHEDPYDRQGQRSSTRCHVVRLPGVQEVAL